VPAQMLEQNGFLISEDDRRFAERQLNGMSFALSLMHRQEAKCKVFNLLNTFGRTEIPNSKYNF